MVRWFRRRPKFKMEPFDFDSLPLPDPISVEQATEEGLMLAEYASRMALKNRILVEGITGDEPYTDTRFVSVAQESLLRLAEESRTAAHRMSDERRGASLAEGIPGHIHDYRAGDSDNLEHREQLSLGVAEALEARAENTDYLIDLVERARSDAWRDVSQSIEQNLDVVHESPDDDPSYSKERGGRIAEFITMDLAELAERAESRGVDTGR